jgi:hypothetical protein
VKRFSEKIMPKQKNERGWFNEVEADPRGA